MKLYEIFEDKDHIYLVLEYMAGGTLIDRIAEKEHYSEKEAADAIRSAVEGIKYCHALGIVHSDIKARFLTHSESSRRTCCTHRRTRKRSSRSQTSALPAS